MVLPRRMLDCLDFEKAPFGKGTLVRFRGLLIEHDLDRKLIERTIEMAEKDKGFGVRQLRAALDSSPLWGAGRVEDTYNLLGHALRKALGVIARRQGRGLAEVADEAGAGIVAASSLKAALDLDWDDPEERERALMKVLEVLETVEGWIAEVPQEGKDREVIRESLEAARQVEEQDVEIVAVGRARLRQGVAKDRRISIEDGEMRHGRKSKSQRVDGYKRHVLRDLDSRMVRAVGITAANMPEAEVTGDIVADLEEQKVKLIELNIDRAYLSSELVRERAEELAVYCKAWPVRNGGRYAKTAFSLDWDKQIIRCPQKVEIAFKVGGVVHFPEEKCQACQERERCTTSRRGRSISIHPDEKLLSELRERQQSAEGRGKLRERVGVEHSLSHIGRWQGRRARYVGKRKNLFDTRRCAVVHNLHVLQRMQDEEQEAA